ncbi:MAG: 4-(cytidine 5'-diphospho)-2-C-methyl-D-erythritol kinase, partial [Erysipelotrichaceae bacterium]
MRLKAYGKINLSLDICGKREDGYHTLKSVFLPIDFYDDVEINRAYEDSFECNQSFLKFNESNTIYKALELMRNEFNIDDKFSVK